jgi:RHS repeat-associated protein
LSSERSPEKRVWTLLDSDALGRFTTIQVPKDDGSGMDVSTIDYDGLTVTHTRPLRRGLTVPQQRVDLSNGLGKLKQVTDAAGNATSYAYDGFGNVLKTTDAQGNVIGVTYDRLGRKTALKDPDLGTWTYKVDPLGQTYSQTDAKKQTTTFMFDELGRLVTRTEPDLVSTWEYDTAVRGSGLKWLGMLGEAYTGPVSAKTYRRILSYDSVGREASVKTSYPTDWDYTTLSGYNSYGQLNSLTHRRDPVGLNTGRGVAFQLAYDNQGQVYEVRRSGVTSALWTLSARNAAGQTTQEDFNTSGLRTLRGYNPYTGTQDWIQTGLAGTTDGTLTDTTVQDEDYDYDEVGNLATRIQLGSSGARYTETFGYDALDRLTSAKVGTVTDSFGYDAGGNLTAKTGVGIYSYPAPGSGSVRPHAVSSITGTVMGLTNPSFGYDANGNLSSGLNRSYGWTAANLPNRIDKLQAGSAVERTEFVYGPERQRLQQLVRPVSGGVAGSPTRIIRYAGDVEKELDYTANKTIVRTTLPLGLGFLEQVINDTNNDATTAATTVAERYYHDDRLGSPIAITDNLRTVLERFSYDAWGRRRKLGGIDDGWGWNANGGFGDVALWNRYGHQGYTGQEQLDHLGLVHLNGRVYDPILGRMTSADPTVPDPSNLQALNRYSYVLNNGLAFVDPSGFGPLETSRTLSHQFDSICGKGLGSCEGEKPEADTKGDEASDGGAPKRAGEIAGQGFRVTKNFLDGGFGDKAAIATENGDYGWAAAYVFAGTAYGTLNVLTFGEAGGVSSLLTTSLTKLETLVVKETLATKGTLAVNQAAGKAAEARAAVDLVAEGSKILGSQVSVRTSAGRRVVDHLIQTRSGQIVAIEVKSGGAVRSARQLAKDRAMATEGGVVIGKNAPDALRGQQILIPTIERRY